MDEELVKSIRICGDSVDAIDECCYEECIQHERPIDPLCMQALYNRAADAIDELDTLLDGVKADNDALCETIERLKKPRWIPVTERLPGHDTNCIVFSGGAVKEAHFYYGKFYDPIEDHMRYNATHWMPLPEPPKEEAK